MPEEEVSVKAKLIDLITKPSEEIIKTIGELRDVTEKDLNELREHLYEYYEGNEAKAEEHYEKILAELEVYYESHGQIVGKSLAELLEVLEEYYGSALELQMEAEDRGIKKIGEVEEAYQDLMRSARIAKTAVGALAASIAAVRSKTVTITVIRKTVYKTVGKAGGGGGGSTGSNPFEENGGRASMSTAEGKVFTEQVTLPALKTLAREGKIDKVVH